MSKDIGERVISVRKKAGLNQREFAARLGISNGGISQIENGKAMPGGEFLLKMDQEFNVDVNWLLTGMSTDGMTRNQNQISPEKQKLIDTFDDMTPDQQRSFLEIGRFYTQPKPGKIAG